MRALHQRHDLVIMVVALALAMVIMTDRGVSESGNVVTAVVIALVAIAVWAGVHHRRGRRLRIPRTHGRTLFSYIRRR